MRRGNLGNMERDMRHDLSAFYLAFAQHFLTIQSWSFGLQDAAKCVCMGEDIYECMILDLEWAAPGLATFLKG